MKTIPGKIVILMVGMILIIGLMILQQFTNVFASTSLIPRATPFSTPTNPAYPPPGRGMMPMENTAYPPPGIDLSSTSQFSKPVSSLTPIPDEISTPTPVVLSNEWYLYTDPDSEFSFSYPPDCVFNAGTNKIDLSKNITLQFLLPNPSSFQGMSIRIEPNTKHLRTEDMVAGIYEKYTLKSAPADFKGFFKEKDINVDGILASQVSIPGTNNEFTIIFLVKENFFIISPMHDLAVVNVDPKALDIFFQILESFKITK